MPLQRIPGVNNHWLAAPPLTNILGLGATLLDAAEDRITMIGRFTHQDHMTKTIDGIEFLLGTVSKAGGSTLLVSLQNVDLTTGPVMREDGVADQTLTIANADAGFVTNAWYGGDFDGAVTRTLAIGELVAVVFQFGAFFAGDSVNIRGITTPAIIGNNQAGVVANLSGTYTHQPRLSNVILRCSDGTFGTIEDAWPCTVVNQHFFNSVDDPDEYAMGVQLPFPYATNGIWVPDTFSGATVQTEILLYDGTTALTTVTIDHNALMDNTEQRFHVSYPEQIHASNALYRIGIRPLSITTQYIFSTSVNEVGHMNCLPGGAAFHLWTRLNQGAWGGEVTTSRLFAGVRLSAFDDGKSIIIPRTILR